MKRVIRGLGTAHFILCVFACVSCMNVPGFSGDREKGDLSGGEGQERKRDRETSGHEDRSEGRETDQSGKEIVQKHQGEISRPTEANPVVIPLQFEGNEELQFYFKEAIEHFRNENWSEFEHFLEKAENLTNHHAISYLRGRRAMREEEYDSAITYFRRAMDRKPDQVLIHYYLGKAYFKTEKKQIAENLFLNSLELDPPAWLRTRINQYLEKISEE